MPANPLISVIIPTFNSSLHLSRCLDSILNQSVKDIEILAVDDLSTDNTLEILMSYKQQVPHMTVIELEQKGLAGGARNAGLSIAKGEFISFVDSDDWLDTNFYHYLVHSIEDGNADISLCGVKREYENAKNSTVRYSYDQSNLISGRYAISLLSKVIDQDISISSIVCNKLFRSRFIAKHQIQFVENCINEDDIFTFHSFLESESVAITDKTSYHLYQRKNSISRDFSKRHVDDLFFSFNVIKNLLNQKNYFDQMKADYYAFFEKCFLFIIESMQSSIKDDESINAFFKYAYVASKDIISIDDFIDYINHKRLINFFKT